VVDAGADQTVVLPVSSALLTGSATDDGLPTPPAALTYSWSQVSGPAGVVFATPDAPNTNATFPGVGVYGLRLTANDSVLSDSDDVTVTVASTPVLNLPPVVDAGADQTVVLPVSSALLTGSATDDGLPTPPAAVTYSWSQISGPAGVIFATPNEPITTATFPGAGVYGLRLTANDSSLFGSDDVTVTVADSTTPAIRINAGGSNFTDSLGRVWMADTNFSGGSTSSTTVAIGGTVEDALYQTERWAGTFSYQIPVTPNTYEVTLHFAEIYWSAAGKRIFDVSLEGALVLDNFDIFQAAGGQFKAVTRTFPVAVTDGTLSINFTSVVNNAKISAIEIHSHPGHPFLHVVIRNPSYVVDYDGNGTQMVPLDGIDSHTHEPGRSLVSWTWREGTTILGTTPAITPVLALGQHNITLTIGDDKTPSDTLQDSTTIHVYPITAVGGVLTTYHPGGTLNAPGAVGYKEVRPALRVEAVNTTIGGSPYTGNVIVVMNGRLQIPTTATYALQTSGGSASQLYLDGTLVTGPRSLNAGIHTIEARISVSSAADLPAEVLISINGSAFAPPGSGTVSHDQTTLAPFVNAITPASGAATGGEPVTVKGLGFFANGSGAVTVNWGSNIVSGSALSIDATGTEIRLLTPAGVGIVPVTVSTPNGTSNSLSFTYDAGSTTVSFQTSVIGNSAITNPTQAAWGPDGRLYVASVNGTISIYTFNDDYNIIATQMVNTIAPLGNPNILGIAFNPFDPPSLVKVYVAHSHLFAHNFGGCFTGPSPYNGQVSVLTGPNFTSAQPLITGLPVSNHDHGINGMEFDNNGDLLIAVGGSTNAGVAGNCNIGQLPESPYSAAILKATLSKGPSFNGTITYTGAPPPSTNNADQMFGEVVDVAPGVDVEVLGAGLRNPFDLVLTTGGRLYATDNGPNFTFGPASTGPDTQAPDPQDDDELVLVEPGDYYGHPNRNRGRDDPREYVYQGNSAPANPAAFTHGLATFPASTNGIMEYRAQTFGGAMRGNLLVQKWNGATFRLTPGADGRSVISNVVLTTSLNGLDILGGPGGVLIGVDYSEGLLKIAKPNGSVTGLAVFDIFPWRAPASGGTPFVIGGSGFGTVAETSVTIGGIPAVVTAVSPTRIKGTIPADLNPTAELLDIIVNSAGQQKALLQAFRYLFSPGQENTGTQALVLINPPNGGLTGASTFQTGSFQVVNQSAAGQKIDRVRIDLRPTVLPDMVFDPSGAAGDDVGKAFTADAGASAAGLDTHFLMSPYALGYDSLEVQFDNFTPGKAFAFSIDVDPTSIQGSAAPGPGESGSVSGLELTGAQVSVFFDDGTLHTGRTFRIPASDVGSQVTLKAGLLGSPTIEFLGLSSPEVVIGALQTVRLSGPVGATVRLLRLEGAMFADGLPAGGFDVDPFEVNSILAVQEYTAAITASGIVDIPVSLTKSHVDGGFNYFVAALVDSSGATGNPSNVVILQYVP
jgi:glucose/arabinose dehydrogenase